MHKAFDKFSTTPLCIVTSPEMTNSARISSIRI